MKTFNLRPVADKVLIKYRDYDMTKSWIMVSQMENGKERPTKGIIVALPTAKAYANSDGTMVPMELEVGNCVYFSKHTCEIIQSGDEKLASLRYSSILAVSDEEIDFDARPEEVVDIHKKSSILQ